VVRDRFGLGRVEVRRLVDLEQMLAVDVEVELVLGRTAGGRDI